MYYAAEIARDFLQMKGNTVEFHDTNCTGHCCGQKEDYGDAAWEFFEAYTRCTAPPVPGCGAIPRTQ